MNICACAEYDEGIKQIEGQSLFCHYQSAAPKYTMPPFRFCPWCGGERLVIVPNEQDMEWAERMIDELEADDVT